jgi:hypothetical protein
MSHQLFISVPNNSPSISLFIPAVNHCSLQLIKQFIQHSTAIPAIDQRLYHNHRLCSDSSQFNFPADDYSFFELHYSLLGGKGGFGNQLRSSTLSIGARVSESKSDCRNLQGVRMKHIEQEQQLKQYLQSNKSAENSSKESKSLLNQQFRRINEGKSAETKMCKFGKSCKYQYKCKFEHPEESTSEEDNSNDNGKGNDAQQGAASSSDSEDIFEAVKAGLKNSKTAAIPNNKTSASNMNNMQYSRTERELKEEVASSSLYNKRKAREESKEAVKEDESTSDSDSDSDCSNNNNNEPSSKKLKSAESESKGEAD